MNDLMSNYERIPLVFARGEGCYLFADDGRRYLDFLSGVAVNSLGHAHPVIEKAIREAACRPIHVSNYYEIPEQAEAAATLCRLAAEASGNRQLYRAVFGNSGAEAVDAALKISRKATGRSHIVSFSGAFHGRTYGALSITHKQQVQQGFAPLLPHCEKAAFNDFSALTRLDRQTAAVIVECVQGEGGVVPADEQWLAELADKARAVGALLIIDEIQTGAGRSGSFFAFQQFGIVPDIITLAKGIGGGVPVGVMLASSAVAEAFGVGTHGSTFAGSPFICSVVNAVLGELANTSFLANVRNTSAYFFTELRKLGIAYPHQLADVRGLGHLIGVEFVEPGAAKKMWISLREKTILCGLAGTNVLRILPPLIVGKTEIDLFLEEFRKQLAAS